VSLVSFFLLTTAALPVQKLVYVKDRTMGLKEYPGYINGYWDDVNGRIILEIDSMCLELVLCGKTCAFPVNLRTLQGPTESRCLLREFLLVLPLTGSWL
jgi:hypothetical protein